MRPTLCQDTLVPTVDAVILRHKGLDERIVDAVKRVLVLISLRSNCWFPPGRWETELGGKREGDGVTEPRVSDPTHPALGKRADAYVTALHTRCPRARVN